MTDHGNPQAHRIWVISDGNPGHYNQSHAFAELLSGAIYSRTYFIDARLKLRGFLRPVLAMAINRINWPFPSYIINLLYSYTNKDSDKPDIIISSGGKTAFLNVILSRIYQCKNVFIGPPPGLSNHCFSFIFQLDERRNCSNCVTLNFIPTRVTLEKTISAGSVLVNEKNLHKRKLWSILIGGESRSHKYTDNDWICLAKAMNKLAERYDISWLISTSRRTGSTAEELLSKYLDSEHVADRVWWSSNPRKVVLAYLGAAEVIFCTQDSLTMLTEAMASGKPVYALYPNHVKLGDDAAGYYVRYLDRNTQSGRIKRVAIDYIEEENIQQDITNYFRPATKPFIDTSILQKLLPDGKKARK